MPIVDLLQQVAHAPHSVTLLQQLNSARFRTPLLHQCHACDVTSVFPQSYVAMHWCPVIGSHELAMHLMDCWSDVLCTLGRLFCLLPVEMDWFLSEVFSFSAHCSLVVVMCRQSGSIAWSVRLWEEQMDGFATMDRSRLNG